jgi:hypothetical protein
MGREPIYLIDLSRANLPSRLANLPRRSCDACQYTYEITLPLHIAFSHCVKRRCASWPIRYSGKPSKHDPRISLCRRRSAAVTSSSGIMCTAVTSSSGIMCTKPPVGTILSASVRSFLPHWSTVRNVMGFPVVFVTAFTGVVILRPVSLWIPLKRTMCLIPLNSVSIKGDCFRALRPRLA